MKMIIELKLNLKTDQVSKAVKNAAKAALKDIVIDCTQDAKEMSPKLTGNNMRSINWELGPGGDTNLEELQAAIFSSSGYGGFLETGTKRMSARPYIYPAVQKNFTESKFGELMKGYLEGE